MDVSVSGPFDGLLSVKGSPCQAEVRLNAQAAPLTFFVPYGAKCGVWVDNRGRAGFQLVKTTQRLLDGGGGSGERRVYYETEEASVLCKYWITLQDVLRGRSPALPLGDKDAQPMPLARNLYPIDMYESPVLLIKE
ncbi:uncharacterized protein LOC129591835 isoform X2 [Paramacrobiotus metropolitanus]|nr:uncharacterized protein LOC129591835 isoform X2 [Paramacrobiotus metropolitanus]